MSCCGTIAVTQQQDVDTEIADQYQTEDDYAQLSIIQEDYMEDISIDIEPIEISPAFNQWIRGNRLEDIKHIFIKHKMTTLETISNESESYRNFTADAELRKYPHVWSAATSAIAALNIQRKASGSDDWTSYQSDIRKGTPNSERLVRFKSIELCNEDFARFADTNLETIANKI
eukprot:296636_1